MELVLDFFGHNYRGTIRQHLMTFFGVGVVDFFHRRNPDSLSFKAVARRPRTTYFVLPAGRLIQAYCYCLLYGNIILYQLSGGYYKDQWGSVSIK